jgi:hypothetical protein
MGDTFSVTGKVISGGTEAKGGPGFVFFDADLTHSGTEKAFARSE